MPKTSPTPPKSNPEQSQKLRGSPGAESPVHGQADEAAQKPRTGPENRTSKTDTVVALLQQPAGATIVEIMRATGWQRHSVRGALAGTIRKRLGQKVVSEVCDGERRYRSPEGRS